MLPATNCGFTLYMPLLISAWSNVAIEGNSLSFMIGGSSGESRILTKWGGGGGGGKGY